MTTDDLHEDPVPRLASMRSWRSCSPDWTRTRQPRGWCLLDREFLPSRSVMQTADHGARTVPCGSFGKSLQSRTVSAKWLDGLQAQSDGFHVEAT